MPDPLRHIFYVSRSLATPLQVEAILARARDVNPTRRLTGSLLFTGGHFAQWLEGPADGLHETMAAIVADPRHEAVKTLLEGALPLRRFADWDMAYAEAPSADDLLASLLTDTLSSERAERLPSLLFKP